MATGKTLGGSSSINGLLYVRGQPQDFNHWRQLGNAGWAWDDVLPLFKRAENWEGGGDDVRGDDGPLDVSRNKVVEPSFRHGLRRRWQPAIVD